jgi:hypothetical protein
MMMEAMETLARSMGAEQRDAAVDALIAVSNDPAIGEDAALTMRRYAVAIGTVIA